LLWLVLSKAFVSLLSRRRKLDKIFLFSKNSKKICIGVQASAYNKDFLLVGVWTPFFIGVKVGHFVAFPMSFLF
jgi:hypothetical protein